jgi:hypothetical protein
MKEEARADYEYKVYTEYVRSTGHTTWIPKEYIEDGWEFVSFSPCAAGSSGCFVHILMRRLY